MRWQDYIEQKPEVMVGKPVIRGTRITVELILERLGNGATDRDILDAFRTFGQNTFAPPKHMPPHIWRWTRPFS